MFIRKKQRNQRKDKKHLIKHYEMQAIENLSQFALSYQLQVIALLESIVSDPFLQSERDALFAALPQGIVKLFFQQIARYNDLKNDCQKHDEKSVSTETAFQLFEIAQSMQKLFGSLFHSDERHHSQVKRYLFAYYATYFPIADGQLVFQEVQHDEGYRLRQQQAKEILQTLMKEQFPLAFYLYTRYLPIEEDHFQYHLQGAKLLAPASQAEFGQHYLTYLQKVLAGEKVAPYSYHVHQLAALTAIAQAAEYGNSLAIHAIAKFLSEFFSAIKVLYYPHDIKKFRQAQLREIANVVKKISGDSCIDNAIEEIVWSDKSLEAKDKQVESILAYIHDRKTGYMAQKKVNQDSVRTLACAFIKESEYLERVLTIREGAEKLLAVDFKDEVSQLLEEELKHQTIRCLTQILETMDRFLQAYEDHQAIAISEADLESKEEKVIKLDKAFNEQKLIFNQERNQSFLKIIKNEIYTLENINPGGHSYEFNLLRGKKIEILQDFVTFYEDHDLETELPQMIINEWKNNCDDDPFVVLAQPLELGQMQRFFLCSKQPPTTYQRFVDYLGRESWLLHPQEQVVDDHEACCACVLS